MDGFVQRGRFQLSWGRANVLSLKKLSCLSAGSGSAKIKRCNRGWLNDQPCSMSSVVLLGMFGMTACRLSREWGFVFCWEEASLKCTTDVDSHCLEKSISRFPAFSNTRGQSTFKLRLRRSLRQAMHEADTRSTHTAA